ncbi:hypothetical protein EVA_11747, partial [gut metagenome]
ENPIQTKPTHVQLSYWLRD